MGGIADSFMSFIGKPFGIYTHTETLTEVQILDLLTLGEADKAARRTAKRSSEGSAKTYHTIHRSFQRQYKRKYSKDFLENIGYDPTSTAKARLINDALLTTYLQSTLGYATVNLLNGRDLYMTVAQKANYGRQFVTNYDHSTNSTTIGGKVYEYSEGIETLPTRVDLRFVRNFSDSIVDNLTDNHSYNSSAGTVIISSEVYDVGSISPSINGSDQYETLCTHPTYADVIILTDVERYDTFYSHRVLDNEVTYAEYSVTSGEVGTETRYFLADADYLSIYSIQEVDMTAIVPLKEDNVVANDDAKLSKMLKQLNLGYDQFIESLDNPDVDAAYLMTGLNLAIDNNAHNKVMFQTFDLLTSGSGDGNFTVAMSKLSMKYSFSFTKSTVLASVAPVGTYVRADVTDDGLTLRYQGSSTEYQEIVITNYNHKYVISGQTVSTGFLNSNTRLIIPLDILNNLKYKEWVDIYERSLCMIGYSVEVVEIKWYETAAFGFLLKIVAVIWTILSVGTDGGSIIAAVQALLTNYAIMELAMLLGEAIGGPVGAVMAAIAAVYLAIKYGDMGQLTGSELWLTSASRGLTTVSQALQHEATEHIATYQQNIEDLDDSIKDILEQNEKFENRGEYYATSSLPFESLGSPNAMFQTSEEYVNSIVNTEWLVDGSWLYDIDRQIATRNQVYSG